MISQILSGRILGRGLAGRIASWNQSAATASATISDISAHAELVKQIRKRRFGVIQVKDRTSFSVRFRWFGKLATVWHVLWAKWWIHNRQTGDTCQIFYDAPQSCPGFIVIKLMRSHRNTSYWSTRTAMGAVAQVAEIRQATAIVFHTNNPRITDRVMKRFGYERHALHLPGRHFIKRLAV